MPISKIKTNSVADEVFDAGQSLIINGDMAVNQRGDTTGQGNSGYYSVDRFRMLINTLGAYNISQSDNAPDGFSYSKRWYCSTADASPAASDYLIVETRLEGQDLQHLDWGASSAKKITLSFWVKSSETGTYIVELSHADATLPYKALQYTIDTADTWEYKTLTFSGDTSDSTPNTNGVGLYINWWLGAGTTFTSGTYNADTWHATNANRAAGLDVNMASAVGNNWNITGVKLEVGSVATPYRHESYADNLRKCQRYYEELNVDGVTQYIAEGFQYNDSGYCNWLVKYTPKRATPTLVGNWTDGNLFYFYADGAGVAVTSFTTNGASTAQTMIHSSGTDRGNGGISGGLYCNTAGARMAFNAEL